MFSKTLRGIALIVLITGSMQAADLVVINANLVTVDEERPNAEAFAIVGRKHGIIGTNQQDKVQNL